jgi:hypothetical protein
MVSSSSFIALMAVLLAAFAFVSAEARFLECEPKYELKRKQCDKLIRKCQNFLGIKMKWTGPGTAVNGVNQGDGGCQCDQYCGYQSPEPCRRDPQCSWIGGMCYNNKFGIPGAPVRKCPLTPAPTAAPTTKSPTFAPSKSPTTALQKVETCFSPADMKMTNRFARDNAPTTCQVSANTGTFQYQVFTFPAPADGNTTLSWNQGNCTTGSGQPNNIFVTLHTKSFNTSDICGNFLFGAGTGTFSEPIQNIPVNDSMVVVLNGNNATGLSTCCGSFTILLN